jgi:hypothetical protein
MIQDVTQSPAPYGASDYFEKSRKTRSDGSNVSGDGQLSDLDQQELEKLKTTDRQVRAEQLSQRTADGTAGSGESQFHVVTGPDGGKYAIAGDSRPPEMVAPPDPPPRRGQLVNVLA